ncbi:hypothetical protein BJV78DRAFT_1286850 [Lactifluus subvellereus]|nr:hypothetical protein BJV78DRAFT_1286850 [Lactifluus subvellereus]
MTVTSTTGPGVKSKSKACAKPALKSDEQRTKEKEDNVARKVKLKAAINIAISQIDDIIELWWMSTTSHSIKPAAMSTWVDASSRIANTPPSRMRIDSVGHELKTEDVSAYPFFSSQLNSPFPGTESDGGQIAEAVRIIKNSEKNQDEYKSLSRDDQATLIALLQGDRDQRETGIVGKSQLRLHDICTTMEKVDTELKNLHTRSRFEPAKLAKHFDAFATNRAGMNGLIRRIASDEHGGDKKTATKSIIMGMFKKMYSELMKRDTFCLDWAAWSKGRPDRRNVIICGWPLATPPTTLSNIHTASEMNKLLTAVIDNTCYFEMAKESDQTTTGLDTPLYKRRGMLIELDSNDSGCQMLINPDSSSGDASETLGRKRKGASDSLDDGNKENISPDEAPPHKCTCQPSIPANHSENIPTLSLPPHCSSQMGVPHTSLPFDEGVSMLSGILSSSASGPLGGFSEAGGLLPSSM